MRWVILIDDEADVKNTSLSSDLLLRCLNGCLHTSSGKRFTSLVWISRQGPSTLIVVVAVYLSTEMLMSENGLLL